MNKYLYLKEDFSSALVRNSISGIKRFESYFGIPYIESIIQSLKAKAESCADKCENIKEDKQERICQIFCRIRILNEKIRMLQTIRSRCTSINDINQENKCRDNIEKRIEKEQNTLDKIKEKFKNYKIKER